MYKINQILIENRGINGNINCQDKAILEDVERAKEEIIANGGILPDNPPFEKHPYLETYELQNFSKYIIGTFPPISYLIDIFNDPNIPHLIKPDNGGNLTLPNTPFYHGNVDDLWRLFLTTAEFLIFDPLPRAIRRDHLINKLIDLEINYSDIIATVQRSAYNANDNGLNNICPNLQLIEHILNSQNAKYLMFDTSSAHYSSGIDVNKSNCKDGIPGKINIGGMESYDFFLRILQDLKFKVEIDLLHRPNWQNTENWIEINVINKDYLKANLKTKVLTKVKITTQQKIFINDKIIGEPNKVFTIITGPSPVVSGRSKSKNFIFQNSNFHDYDEFRRHIYQLFRAGNWDALQAMNI
jgi:hypothetical protein